MYEVKQFEPLWGSWHVKELIGEGGYGKVYKIEREEFGTVYTSAMKYIRVPKSQSEVKSILAEGLDEEAAERYFKEFVSHLVKEVELMAKVKGNSNIVSYEDHKVIKTEGKIEWHLFIRMELLTSLVDYVNSAGKITRQDIIRLGIDICRALEICQKHNIIHRDIKPENIFVSPEGYFKLGDFGIARQIEKTVSGLSKKGTYTYMAPEVYLGKEYGSTVDIYSLGIVMYRFLNQNRTPFLPPYPQKITSDDREQALVVRMSGKKELPKPVNADGRLAEIVLKACSYEPKDRYDSPREMRKALEDILLTDREEGELYGSKRELENPKTHSKTAETEGVTEGVTTGYTEAAETFHTEKERFKGSRRETEKNTKKEEKKEKKETRGETKRKNQREAEKKPQGAESKEEKGENKEAKKKGGGLEKYGGKKLILGALAAGAAVFILIYAIGTAVTSPKVKETNVANETAEAAVDYDKAVEAVSREREYSFNYSLYDIEGDGISEVILEDKYGKTLEIFGYDDESGAFKSIYTKEIIPNQFENGFLFDYDGEQGHGLGYIEKTQELTRYCLLKLEDGAADNVVLSEMRADGAGGYSYSVVKEVGLASVSADEYKDFLQKTATNKLEVKYVQKLDPTTTTIATTTEATTETTTEAPTEAPTQAPSAPKSSGSLYSGGGSSSSSGYSGGSSYSSSSSSSSSYSGSSYSGGSSSSSGSSQSAAQSAPSTSSNSAASSGSGGGSAGAAPDIGDMGFGVE